MLARIFRNFHFIENKPAEICRKSARGVRISSFLLQISILSRINVHESEEISILSGMDCIIIVPVVVFEDNTFETWSCDDKTVLVYIGPCPRDEVKSVQFDQRREIVGPRIFRGMTDSGPFQASRTLGARKSTIRDLGLHAFPGRAGSIVRPY